MVRYDEHTFMALNSASMLRLDAELFEFLIHVRMDGPDQVRERAKDLILAYAAAPPPPGQNADMRGKLIYPDWIEFFRMFGDVAWGHFPGPPGSPCALARRDVFTRIVDLVENGTTPRRKEERIILLERTLAEFLELAGFVVPPRNTAMKTSELASERPSIRLKTSTNDARDHFIYKHLSMGQTRKWIKLEVSKNKTWESLDTEQGISAAACRYARRHKLPWPLRSAQS